MLCTHTKLKILIRSEYKTLLNFCLYEIPVIIITSWNKYNFIAVISKVSGDFDPGLIVENFTQKILKLVSEVGQSEKIRTCRKLLLVLLTKSYTCMMGWLETVHV